jgi:integrase
MATFVQRESGYWQAIIRRRGHPQQSKTFQTKTAAQEWARAIEAAMDKGGFVSSAVAEGTTFSDLARRFTEEFAPHHYRGEAWGRKLASLKVRLGAYSLVALTPQVVTRFRDDRLKDPDSRYTKNLDMAPTVSPATVKGELDLLSKVLDVAEKEFGITLPAGNPVRHIRKPAGGAARDRRLTPDEWTKLLAECRASGNRYLAPAVVLAVETAMRQGELLQLERRHIDKKRRLAMLLDPSRIKTGEPRAVPLSSAALAALEELPTAIAGPLIPLGRMTLYKAFERACQRAGIQGYCWHLLRHEALSRLAERGDFSVLELAAVSGHKTLQMLKRYTHLQAENLAKKLG